jgi:hypothetical protein
MYQGRSWTSSIRRYNRKQIGLLMGGSRPVGIVEAGQQELTHVVTSGG